MPESRIRPEKLLFEKSSWFITPRFDKPGGIGPWRLLWFRWRMVMRIRFARLDGMVPLSLLLARSRYVRLPPT